MSDKVSWLNELLSSAKVLLAIGKKAARHSQTLSGANFYARKFHDELLKFTRLEALFLRYVESLDPALLDESVRLVTSIKSLANIGAAREQAARGLDLLVHSKVLPSFDESASPAPLGEPVLPKAVVIPAKKPYLITITVQANACHESRCFDACSVMIRKLVETLIIELYESAGKDSEIKGSDGNFFMLSDLIQRLLSSSHWNLARETKITLPKLKSLGDRAAHNRRYVATRADVESVIPGLRVVVDDLLHLAGLK